MGRLQMASGSRVRTRPGPGAGRGTAGRAVGGFSLIELVAVMALIAIVVTTMAFGLSRGLKGTQVRAASRDMAAAMRYTRGQAIVKREERALVIDVDGKTYTAPGKAPVSLPEDMDISVLAARIEQTDEQTVGIRFFPDGSSTGGRVRLLSNQREWVVNVAWLTGEISLEEARQ